MKIYLAGKITGDPDYRAKFMMARRQLEKQGHVVLSPAVLPEGLKPGDYMQICTAMIDVADAVAFLPDWWDSAGAKVEQQYAAYAGKTRLWPWGKKWSNEYTDCHIFTGAIEVSELGERFAL